MFWTLILANATNIVLYGLVILATRPTSNWLYLGVVLLCPLRWCAPKLLRKPDNHKYWVLWSCRSRHKTYKLLSPLRNGVTEPARIVKDFYYTGDVFSVDKNWGRILISNCAAFPFTTIREGFLTVISGYWVLSQSRETTKKTTKKRETIKKQTQIIILPE